MPGPAVLKLQIIADSSKATSALADMSKSADNAGSGAVTASTRLKSLGKAAAYAAGAAALGALVAVTKTGMTETQDFLKGQAQLEAGIKSTGNAAHVSVKGMEDLASSIQSYSGQTDDSIVAAESLMLTFTNVKNAAGPMNDIFNQSIKLTADMAARMGGDASKYAVLLGKALNDPVKGMTALTRVGVSFTEGQKDQVKAMVKAGDTLGAQKVIIAELNKEFGGSAKAFGDTMPGQIERTKRAYEDLSQQIVMALLPIMNKLTGVLLKDIMPALSKVADFIAKNINWLLPLAAAIGTVITVMKVLTTVTRLFGITLSASTWQITLIVAAIVAFVGGIIYAYNHFKWFRDFVNATFRFISKAAKVFWNAMKVAFQAVAKVVVSVGKTIGKAVSSAVRVIATVAKTIFKIWVTPYRLAWLAVKNLVTKWAPTMFKWIKNVVDRIKAALSSLVTHVTAPFARAWDWVKSHVSGWASSIGSWMSNVVSRVRSALSSVKSAITSPFESAWSWVQAHFIHPMSNMFDGVIAAIRSALSGVTSAITAPFEAAWNWIQSHIIGPLKSGWNGIANAINGIHFEVKVPKGIPGIGGKGFTFDPPTVPTLASGAYVNKATLAYIGEGSSPEFVMPDDKMRRLLREELSAVGPTIVVQGALDPDAVARQIEKLLRARAQRVGGVRQVGTASMR